MLTLFCLPIALPPPVESIPPLTIFADDFPSDSNIVKFEKSISTPSTLCPFTVDLNTSPFAPVGTIVRSEVELFGAPTYEKVPVAELNLILTELPPPNVAAYPPSSISGVLGSSSPNISTLFESFTDIICRLYRDLSSWFMS